MLCDFCKRELVKCTKIGKFDIPIDYNICNNCKTAFLDNKYKLDTKKYYSESYEKWFYSLSDKLTPIKNSFTDASSRLFLITEYIDIKDKKILDIGCGVAGSLSLMKTLGAKVKGLEPSINFSKFNNDVLNIDVENGFIENYNTSEKYDMITLFDVIEHMENPKNVLSSVFNLLDENGYLFFTTPHIKKSDSSIIYQQSHYFLFSIGSISKLLYETGFSLYKIILFGGSINIFAKKNSNNYEPNFDYKYLEEYSNKELKKYKLNIPKSLLHIYKLAYYHYLSMKKLNMVIKAIKNN